MREHITRSFGALFIDKPSGVTSFQVVHQVRKKFQLKRVGHCGTLDPDATGLLILLIEGATRFQCFITADDKEYTGVIRLGVTTSTDDISGEVLEERPVPSLSPELLRDLERRFSGAILQTPPSFSAIKVDGQRAYRRARSGEEVFLKAREVTVRELLLSSLEGGKLHYRVNCSKGFYVRSLARDIGQVLGCGGAAETIHRERIGRIRLERAIPLSELLQGETLPTHEIGCLLPEMEVVLTLDQAELRELLLGRSKPLLRLAPLVPPRGAFLALPSGEIRGRLNGMGRVQFLIPDHSGPFKVSGDVQPVNEEF